MERGTKPNIVCLAWFQLGSSKCWSVVCAVDEVEAWILRGGGGGLWGGMP